MFIKVSFKLCSIKKIIYINFVSPLRNWEDKPGPSMVSAIVLL
jgi:hypothetical protein